MATPEGITKKKIVDLLKKYGCYYFMPVQNGMGAPGLDFHCCVHGVAFFVEAKAWNTTKSMTARQTQTATKIMDAGGHVFMVRDPETLAELDKWLVDVMITKGGCTYE